MGDFVIRKERVEDGGDGERIGGYKTRNDNVREVGGGLKRDSGKGEKVAG